MRLCLVVQSLHPVLIIFTLPPLVKSTAFFLRVYILLLCQQQAAALFLLIKSNHFSHAFSYTNFPSIRICFLYSCIHYLHKSHNTPLLPPKICIGFVFDFHVPGEIANNDYAVFWGVKEVYYGICASSELLSLLLLYLFYIGTEKPHQGTVTFSTSNIAFLAFTLAHSVSIISPLPYDLIGKLIG